MASVSGGTQMKFRKLNLINVPGLVVILTTSLSVDLFVCTLILSIAI